mmetsp:Transcript_13823/g.37501  ORF Transcript_13823/g.37501 Transcript_13823/m.37501 type:complete len:209 (-) Transcript_13823:688-1314(-)
MHICSINGKQFQTRGKLQKILNAHLLPSVDLCEAQVNLLHCATAQSKLLQCGSVRLQLLRRARQVDSIRFYAQLDRNLLPDGRNCVCPLDLYNGFISGQGADTQSKGLLPAKKLSMVEVDFLDLNWHCSRCLFYVAQGTFKLLYCAGFTKAFHQLISVLVHPHRSLPAVLGGRRHVERGRPSKRLFECRNRLKRSGFLQPFRTFRCLE